MKILQVVPYFFVDWVSDRKHKPVETVYEVSRALVKLGHDVTVYTTEALNKKRRTDGEKESIYEEEGIKFREFNSFGNRLGAVHHIIISPAMIPVIRQEMRSFDVIHLHEYRTFQNVIAHHYAVKHGVPYVVQAHGSLPRIMSKQVLKQVFDRFWGYRLLNDASRVIAVTGMEAGQYESFGVGRDKIEIIPNGIDLSQFDRLPEKGEFRKKYGLADNQKIVLYLGRINEIKGLDILVRAFADLSRKLNDVRLVIVGQDDGYQNALEQLITDVGINDSVLFTGPLYGMEKLSAYVDAEVYVLPSVYEIFGITVIEAGACGTPVIVTDRCGLADVVEGQSGMVVSPGVEPLSGAILSMLGDPKMRWEFGEKGRSLVREKFNWEILVEQMERVYQEIQG